MGGITSGKAMASLLEDYYSESRLSAAEARALYLPFLASRTSFSWQEPNARLKRKSGLAYYLKDPKKKHWHRTKAPWDGRYIWVLDFSKTRE